MKNKTFVSAILVISILLSVILIFNGCSAQLNESEPDEVEITEAQEMPNIFTAIVIEDVKDANYTREIINEINTSKLISENEHKYNDSYQAVRISNIKAFYSLNNFEIHGYELYKVLILGDTICYYYAPINSTADRSSLCFSNGSAILLQITRFDNRYGDIPSRVTIEQLAEIFDGQVIGNNLFFVEGSELFEYNELGGLIGETWFAMKVPKSVDFDVLCDIGAQLVVSAELVDVQAEIDIIRQSEN
ncbi:MAG: hypothetical protein LBC82_04780 [Oscillospiraceae bacterium]|jgi:hypothetical protein|nr:hypothetical protein [Oscillospiraceae bacterium]